MIKTSAASTHQLAVIRDTLQFSAARAVTACGVIAVPERLARKIADAALDNYDGPGTDSFEAEVTTVR